ncbi:MAG: acyl--CoA ligase [Oscillospiraceae bacterium]|nr:acyl--CoA ligase [Oscillospiraceae bacterium]
MDNTSLMELIREAGANCSEETLKHFLFLNGISHPQKMAYEWFDEKKGRVTGVTYQELITDIMALGTVFYNNGWKGKTISIVGRTSFSWVLVFLTCICSDMVVLPLDPALDAEELAKRLHHCRAEVVFTDSDIQKTLEEQSTLGSDSLLSLAELESLLEKGTAFLEAGDRAWIDDYVKDSQPALMIFTSGTGGKMKAAVIRQENLTAERFVWKGMEADKSKCLLTLPLFHIAGIGDLRGTLLVGTTAYLSAGLRHLLWDYQYAQPVTTFMVPAQAELICNLLKGRSPEEAKQMLGGRLVALRTSGAPMPENRRALFASWNIDVTSDYGMTETCGPVSVSVMKNSRLFSKPGSVGRILDCLDVRIDNPDENGRGEIIIAGRSVFDGYFEDPEETGKILQDGWLHTGDIGYIDEDRYLYIVGRKKNIIVLPSGENIIPEDPERVISGIPNVKECIVFEKSGSLAVRIYTGETGREIESEIEKEIEKLFRFGPSYRKIRCVEFSACPLPKTATGKLRR